jgi:uncharacterized Fe-S cluster-containing protein
MCAQTFQRNTVICLQDRNIKDGGIILLRNLGKLLTDYTVLHAKK